MASITKPSQFQLDSEAKAFDLEHRRKIRFNIGKYNAAVQTGLGFYQDHELARERGSYLKSKVINNLDQYLLEFERNFTGRAEIGNIASDDFSFKVSPGEIVSVIGPNGAGKTTLFNMISGVYQPGRGRVVLNGENVTGMAPHLLARRGMSRTFQNLQIFQSMTVLENAIAGYHLSERGPVLADLLGLPSSRRRAAAASARRQSDRQY